jgi:hypothetical protein
MSLFNVFVTIFLDPMYSSHFDPHIVRPVYDPFFANVPGVSNFLCFISRRLVILLHATFDIGRALVVLSIVSLCCVSSCIRKLCILPATTANSVRIPHFRRTSA